MNYKYQTEIEKKIDSANDSLKCIFEQAGYIAGELQTICNLLNLHNSAMHDEILSIKNNISIK